MARSVQQLDVDGADGDLVAVLVRGQAAHGNAGDPRDPIRFVGVDVHRDFDPLEEFGQARQGEAHHRPADVVGVVVGDQDAGQVHTVGLERVDQVAGGVGRIDHDGVAGFPVTDQVGEVAHLLRHHVAGGKIPAREQLAEIQTVRRCHGFKGRRRRVGRLVRPTPRRDVYYHVRCLACRSSLRHTNG